MLEGGRYINRRYSVVCLDDITSQEMQTIKLTRDDFEKHCTPKPSRIPLKFTFTDWLKFFQPMPC